MNYAMISKEEVLDRTHWGLDIFKHYIGFPIRLGKNFKNPLYQDRNASCNIYFDRHAQVFKMKDFGNEEYSGDCFWFVAAVTGLDVKRDFYDIIKRIVSDLNLIVNDSSGNKPRKVQIKRETVQYKDMDEMPTRKDFRIEIKSFSEEELGFWKRYGITTETLDRYGVRSVKAFDGYNRSNESYRINSTANEPMFAYTGTGYVKIYRPNNSKCVFSMAGKCRRCTVSGWNNCQTKAIWFLLRVVKRMSWHL